MNRKKASKSCKIFYRYFSDSKKSLPLTFTTQQYPETLKDFRNLIIESKIQIRTPVKWKKLGKFWLVMKNRTISPDTEEIFAVVPFRAPSPFNVDEIPWLSATPNYFDETQQETMDYEIYELKNPDASPVLVQTLRGYSLYIDKEGY